MLERVFKLLYHKANKTIFLMSVTIFVSLFCISSQADLVILYPGCHCEFYIIWLQPEFCVGSVFTVAMGTA